MKKSIKKASKSKPKFRDEQLTIGLDVGDASTNFCALDGSGEIALEGRFATTKVGVTKFFATLPKCRVALEVGIHSPWMSRQVATH